MTTAALTTTENHDTALTEVMAEQQRFELAQRKAQIYAKSTLVPKVYQNNVGNVLIAENMARRMGADTLMVMQNLYIVHGNPGWSASFLIGSFNSNGRFSAIKYRFKGEPGAEDWGCQAYCTEIATGEEISGTWITWGMAKKEGWVSKNGSKWQSMPEQMFRYRSATFLIRATAPEIGLGLLTKDELDDMHGGSGNGNGNGHSTSKAGIAGLKERLPQIDEVDVAEADEALARLQEAPTIDNLHTEPEGDYVDASALEPPADADEAIDVETEPVDALEALRANVQAAFDAEPKPRQRDLIAGKPTIAAMNEQELNALLDTMLAE